MQLYFVSIRAFCTSRVINKWFHALSHWQKVCEYILFQVIPCIKIVFLSEITKNIFVPIINRWGQCCKPRVLFLHRLKCKFACLCVLKDVQARLLRVRGKIVLRRTVVLANNPPRSRHATLACALTRPLLGMFGFSLGFPRLVYMGFRFFVLLESLGGNNFRKQFLGKNLGHSFLDKEWTQKNVVRFYRPTTREPRKKNSFSRVKCRWKIKNKWLAAYFVPQTTYFFFACTNISLGYSEIA